MTTAISIEDVRREVKILKALSGHENLVKFYDAFEDAHNVYIVMEYVFSCNIYPKRFNLLGLRHLFSTELHVHVHINALEINSLPMISISSQIWIIKGQSLKSVLRHSWFCLNRLCEGGELLDRILSR